MTIYKAGDVLQECEPFALLLLEVNKGKNCDYCFKVLDKPKRCATCRTMYYCSRECANGDWKLGHKFKECQVLKDNDIMEMIKLVLANARSNRNPISFITTLKFVLRLVLKKMFGPVFNQKFKMADGTMMGFEDLPDYSGYAHMETQPLLSKLLNIVNVALLKSGFKVDGDDVWKIYLKYVENSIGVSSYIFASGAVPTGRGIYIYKEFAHSCCNNCVRVSDGTKTFIRAIRDFDTETEPPSLCRANVTDTRAVRWDTLLQYNVICECDRCVDNIEFPGTDLRSIPKSKLVTTLRKYISDTKKVHKGGRSPQLLRHSHLACMMLKVQHMFSEAQEFERDMEITAKVLYGDDGWTKVQEEIQDPNFRFRMLNMQ